MPRERLKRRAERSEEQIDPADAGLLELLNTLPHRTGHQRLHVFPVAAILRTTPQPAGRTAGEEDRAVGCRLVPDVQAAAGLGC